MRNHGDELHLLTMLVFRACLHVLRRERAENDEPKDRFSTRDRSVGDGDLVAQRDPVARLVQLRLVKSQVRDDRQRSEGHGGEVGESGVGQACQGAAGQ